MISAWILDLMNITGTLKTRLQSIFTKMGDIITTRTMNPGEHNSVCESKKIEE